MIFGPDVFFAYSRCDGVAYASGLAAELTRRGFSCFLDQWSGPPGSELPVNIMHVLRNSRMLVVIGTDGARESTSIATEIDEYLRHHAKAPNVVVIAFDQVLIDAKWIDRLAGIAQFIDTKNALTSGVPSVFIPARIELSFAFRNRQRRLWWITLGSA
jgi:hypothetical protein